MFGFSSVISVGLQYVETNKTILFFFFDVCDNKAIFCEKQNLVSGTIFNETLNSARISACESLVFADCTRYS